MSIFLFKFFGHSHQLFQCFCIIVSINSNIFFFLISEVGLSVTTTNEGLFEEALIRPQEPSSKEKRTPFTVNISVIFDHLFLCY